MLEITPIPALADNYIWCLRRPNAREVVLVDPGDRRVLEVLKRDELDLRAILITHQHVDHVAAVKTLLQHFPQAKVYGPAGRVVSEHRFGSEMPVPELIQFRLREGDRVCLPVLDTEFGVIDLPGHTLDHIGYLGPGILFCGDTVFSCGCGRIMGGDARMFSDSLRKIAALPADTQLYCSHEYTLDNIGFARWVEPDNTVLIKRDEDAMALQEKGRPTLPTSLQMELNTNPFLRFDQPAVRQAAEKYSGRVLNTDAEVFAAIREWKDREYD